MHTEAQRRLDGRIAAERCLQASYVATDRWTRAALERCAARYMLKALGFELEDLGTAAGEEDTAVPLLDPWENQQTRATGGRGL